MSHSLIDPDINMVSIYNLPPGFKYESEIYLPSRPFPPISDYESLSPIITTVSHL